MGQPTVKSLGGGPVLCSSPLVLATDPKDNSNPQNPACTKPVPTQSIARLVRMGQKHRTKGRGERKGEDEREGEKEID